MDSNKNKIKNNKKRDRDLFENNNNCNSNSNNNENLIKLYNSVFNNCFLRKIIFSHLNKFNILSVDITFRSIKEWNEFKYKEYLYIVTLDFNDDQFDFHEQLPENIKHLTIRAPFPPPIKDIDFKTIPELPNHIESFSYADPLYPNFINILKQHKSSSKIRNLIVDGLTSEFYGIQPNELPKSVTYLDITVADLSKNVIPANVKKLEINSLESFENGCLEIESLNDIYITNSIPTIINQLSKASSINLVKLSFIHRVNINSNIKFPNSLQELIVECNTFKAKLPENLKSLKLNIIFDQNPIKFPSSLENLSIITRNQSNHRVFTNCQSVPPNLKSLELSCPTITDINGQSILPKKLEKLVFCFGEFNQLLQVNQLPSTLTYLNFGLSKFNQVIDVNVLPENLNTLVFGPFYSQIINPLAIPQQLKLLLIKNDFYPYSISLTPSTHPYTEISTNSSNAINLFYQATLSDYNQIRMLRLPNKFFSPLSTLQLQNKLNLEYLHLGQSFNQEIQLSDLPTPNNIKTLELSFKFSKAINLEHFQNLETLIINTCSFSFPTLITSTTTIIDDQKQQHVHYNNYKLKNILVEQKFSQFLLNLDPNFYQFLKYK